jgi:hypothetical protein
MATSKRSDLGAFAKFITRPKKEFQLARIIDATNGLNERGTERKMEGQRDYSAVMFE